MSNFLQSNEWVEFQKSLGREVLEYEKEGISAKIIKHDLPLGKNYLYIPHGPEMDFNSMAGGLKNPVAHFVKWLREEGKKRKSIFIKAEPVADSAAQTLAEHKFKKSKKEIQPGKTAIIELNKDDDEILGAMHHKTRYNIKVAEKNGVEVKESENTDLFLALLKKTTARDRFSSHPENYYRMMLGRSSLLKTKLFLAFSGKRPVAGAIVLIYGGTGFYLHGASDYEYRAMMAPYMLHWQIIKFLKANDVKKYDLWGIEPRKWPGVTRFKLGWGGRIIEYPGSFDLPISKFWHLLYRAYRNFKK